MGKATRTTGATATGVAKTARGPANTIAGVQVSTNTEVRPEDVQTVVWVGGSAQPVNKSSGDLWFPGAGVAGVYSARRDLVADLLASTPPFYIAHRGGADDGYAEHTAEAYDGAFSRGVRAVEMSAQVTADGVPICLHDVGAGSLTRTTTLTTDVAATMWADIQGSIVDAATVDSSNYGLGAGYGKTFAVPNLGPQLAKWAHNGVVFLEPKAGSSSILQAAAMIPEPGKTIIWKFYRTGAATIPSHAQSAKAMGMKLWIYVDDTESDSVIDLTGQVCDAIGIPVTATDAKIARCVATGKPVIVHPVRKRSERDRLLALGVKGIMCTCPSYVGNDTARMTTAYGLASGFRAPGDHWSLDTRQGTFDATLGQLILGQGNTGGLLMGSMCPIKDSIAAATQYRISFEMKWATIPGTGTTHSDIFFGHTTDKQYQFQSALNEDSGYHAFIRADGTLGLSTHTAGVASGTSLGTQASATPVADTWMTFEVDVTTTQVIFRRTDNAANVTAANTSFRGGYFGFNAGSTTPAPFVRNVTVIAI